MQNDKDAANAIEKLISYLAVTVYTISVLEIMNIPLKSFAFIGGALAIGIGLGGQNLMNNFISSLIIMIERPIKIGDIVEINNMTGRITSIGARCIALTSFSNVEILVPNSKVMQNVLVNWTFADHIVYNSAVLRVSKLLDQKPKDLITTVENALREVQGVCHSIPPSVYLSSMDDDEYVYQVNFGSDLTNLRVPEIMHSRINLALLEILDPNLFSIKHLKLVSSSSQSESESDSSSSDH
jgi:small-conductance mechanosensitive channel